MILSTLIALAGGSLRLDAKWAAPADLPFPRVHAIVRSGDGYFVGGLKGLARQKGGKWEIVDERPVREMASSADSIWVLYGDGSVDKIEPKTDRLFFDIMAGATKRPWISCLGTSPRSVLFGGTGGWVERTQTQAETYPEEMKAQIATAIARDGDTLWVGTQRNGLYRIAGSKLDRFGFAAGLPDSWVTALTFQDGHLVVGFADGGICEFDGAKFAAVPCPCSKVRKLALFRGRLVVGGMDGAWVEEGTGWKQLGDEETTALAIDGDRLAIGSPTGVTWWR